MHLSSLQIFSETDFLDVTYYTYSKDIPNILTSSFIVIRQNKQDVSADDLK